MNLWKKRVWKNQNRLNIKSNRKRMLNLLRFFICYFFLIFFENNAERYQEMETKKFHIKKKDLKFRPKETKYKKTIIMGGYHENR